MSDLVVDSSAAVKWFVPEPYSTEHLFQGLAADDAKLVIENFHKLKFTFVPTASLLDEAYDLAAAHHRSVYDMLYLALSIRQSCEFATADDRLVNAIGSLFPNMIWLANWP